MNGEAVDHLPAPTLLVEGLVAGYLRDIDILRGVDLAVRPGEIVALLGPNGAGKSTLVKAIFGLVQVRSGRIEIDGQDVTGLRTFELARQGIGYVPQMNNVFARLSVEENLEMGGVMHRGGQRSRMEALYELFPKLASRRRQDAALLSGGERQMLAIARALMAEPRVLLLDEPSAALAPVAINEVFDRIRQINAQGVTVVLVEQNARKALELARRAYVLESGQNRFEGTGDQLLNDDEVVRLYLGGLVSRNGATAGTTAG